MTIVTKNQLATALQVSRSTIDRLRAEGVLQAYHVRRQLRFCLEDVWTALGKAESELPRRRADGSFVLSDGKKVPTGLYLTGRTAAGDIEVEAEDEK